MGSVATALVEMAKIKKDDSSLAPMLSRIEKQFDEQAVINKTILQVLQQLLQK